MKINTKQKKNDGIPAPQIRVRSNLKSGIIYVANNGLKYSLDGKHVYSIVEAPALL